MVSVLASLACSHTGRMWRDSALRHRGGHILEAAAALFSARLERKKKRFHNTQAAPEERKQPLSSCRNAALHTKDTVIGLTAAGRDGFLDWGGEKYKLKSRTTKTVMLHGHGSKQILVSQCTAAAALLEEPTLSLNELVKFGRIKREICRIRNELQKKKAGVSIGGWQVMLEQSVLSYRSLLQFPAVLIRTDFLTEHNMTHSIHSTKSLFRLVIEMQMSVFHFTQLDKKTHVCSFCHEFPLVVNKIPVNLQLLSGSQSCCPFCNRSHGDHWAQRGPSIWYFSFCYSTKALQLLNLKSVLQLLDSSQGTGFGCQCGLQSRDVKITHTGN